VVKRWWTGWGWGRVLIVINRMGHLL